MALGQTLTIDPYSTPLDETPDALHIAHGARICKQQHSDLAFMTNTDERRSLTNQDALRTQDMASKHKRLFSMIECVGLRKPGVQNRYCIDSHHAPMYH